MDSEISYEPQRSSLFGFNRLSTRTYVYNTLLQMGFPSNNIKTAILYTNSSDVNFLITFLTKGPQGWEHDFIRKF